MKIFLPNAAEITDPDQYFDQLELCVYHARKAWEKMKVQYSEEDLTKQNVTPSVRIVVPAFIDQYDTEIAISRVVDNQQDQEIFLEIVE